MVPGGVFTVAWLDWVRGVVEEPTASDTAAG
jgi:hypothetical protein